MDNVALALSVSIAVVMVLLLSCWNTKPKRAAQDQARARARGCGVPRQRYSDLPDGGNVVSTSDWGSGLSNAVADARLDDMRDNLLGYEDYSQVAQMMSLEPSIHESHSQYSNDMNQLSLGPSTISERSDDVGPVTRWGLRRVDYQSVSAGHGARQEHSEIPDQLSRGGGFSLGASDDTYGF